MGNNKVVSVLGAGRMGKDLSYRLVSKGYKVKASNTTDKNITRFTERGITPYKIDLTNFNTNYDDFLDCNTLVLPITLKKINVFEYFISVLEKSSIKKVLFISSTSVYEENNEIVTESTITNDSILAKIEQLFLINSHFETTIIRFGGLFGYGTRPVDFISATRKMKSPKGFVNLIHREDALCILEEIILQNVWGEVFNAVADTHPQREIFYKSQAEKYGKPMPVFDETTPSTYKIVSNEKIKNILNYQFRYGDLLSI